MASHHVGMEPLQIEVTGESEVLLPAERANLNINVVAEGPSKTKVSQGVISSARQVELLLRNVSVRKGDQVAPVDYWSRTALKETNQAPWDPDKKIYLQRTYRAAIDYSISVQKFEKLGSLIQDVVAIEHVSSQGVEWVLTKETINAQHSSLRTKAAKFAFSKAHDYALALGFTKVVAVKCKEEQQYTRSSSRKSGIVPSDGMQTTAKNMAEIEDWEDVGEEVFQYTPQEVKMSQSCSVQFSATQ